MNDSHPIKGKGNTTGFSTASNTAGYDLYFHWRSRDCTRFQPERQTRTSHPRGRAHKNASRPRAKNRIGIGDSLGAIVIVPSGKNVRSPTIWTGGNVTCPSHESPGISRSSAPTDVERKKVERNTMRSHQRRVCMSSIPYAERFDIFVSRVFV